MIRQAISPRFAMRRDWIISAGRPPIAVHRPGPVAVRDRERRWCAAAVTCLLNIYPTGLADRQAMTGAALAAAIRQSGELPVADPADRPAGAGLDHEVVPDSVDVGAAPRIERKLAAGSLGCILVLSAQREQQLRSSRQGHDRDIAHDHPTMPRFPSPWKERAG